MVSRGRRDRGVLKLFDFYYSTIAKDEIIEIDQFNARIVRLLFNIGFAPIYS